MSAIDRNSPGGEEITVKWLKKNYGSKRGFVAAHWHRLKYYLGLYKRFKVDWSRVDRVIFVCTGNICRSAYAEVVARSHQLNTASSGICARVGASANQSAIAMAEKRGFDLTQHSTTPAMYDTYGSRDLLVAMEPWQAELLLKHMSAQTQVTLLGMHGFPRMPYLPDPYGQSDDYFNHCFQLIENFVNEIETKFNK
ncbi:MAG: hypothetical protein OEY38_06530 [Gammaproteobacteria bacterium]|nr:hypothetical protein [Gammaproteobacteria bacterium]